jgi:vancomycin permeability regulator SanA
MKLFLKIFWWLVALGLFGFICAMIMNSIIIDQASPYVYTPETVDENLHTQTIMVLGAKVNDGGTLSNTLYDRVIGGISLYTAGFAPNLLLSGDHGTKGYDEVNAMKNCALDAGVPLEDIFLDHAGFSTYESMYRARDVFQVESMFVVTQDYHIFRAVYLARKMGIEAYGVISSPRAYMNQGWFELREMVARVKDFLYINVFKPLPTYLGDPIPITGDSALSHDDVT